jgi:hypothetical protein
LHELDRRKRVKRNRRGLAVETRTSALGRQRIGRADQLSNHRRIATVMHAQKRRRRPRSHGASSVDGVIDAQIRVNLRRLGVGSAFDVRRTPRDEDEGRDDRTDETHDAHSVERRAFRGKLTLVDPRGLQTK